jgi:lysozyme family protein
MQHPFEVLRPEYESLLARMVITRKDEIEAVAHKLLGFVHVGRYTQVSIETGVPVVWMATSFEREASSDFSRSPAQGDHWNAVSIHVPRGRGPFPSWAAAAKDAYHIDGLDQIGAGNWTAARACYEGEVFNGFGYRAHGVHSPYLWAGSNNYVSGKYVADGVWDAHHVDTQLGIVPVMLRMIALEPSLDFAMPAPPLPAPIGVGGDETGARDTKWIQHALNTLQIDGTPLVEDGNYGRHTRAVVVEYQTRHGLTPDGLAGPLTIAQLEKDVPA